ncbi:transcription termination/antitermination factor NusG [Marivirga sp. S37H4]|uniref:Transcription termination/antitermination protein NusG n=1 Tax=Marivirga aurantiaca TaxID=2802615 RepID=A0A934X2D4_9BACT|nr:transcription termination/antitermination protein NusG [Marivirga aurantiaca]MBK6267201.1 transcription termination/antitermination factor NusG [Marivirga aurantiaca]
MSEFKWYVLRVVSGQEKKIKTYLDNEIARQKLEEHIPQILIPTEKVYEMRNGKKRVRERNFFPGYVFVSADLSYGEANHVITSIPGVIGFLGGEGSGDAKVPVPLRQSEVNRILGKVDETEEMDEKLSTPFIIGESVKVMDGPFSGFTGSVEEVFEERKKLNVMVKIFGRNTPVELNYMQVEKTE